MKKVITLIMGFALASVAGAASINWGASVGSVKDPDNASANLTGAVAYLFDASVVSVADALVMAANGTFSSANAIDNKTSLGGGNFNATSATLSEALIRGQSTDFYLVIFNTSDTTSGYFQISGIISQSPYDAQQGDPNPGNVLWANANIGTGSGGWQEIVPEPTSLALLALGVAAIGLRRKVK